MSLNLLDLPDNVLESIFGPQQSWNYDEIAKNRLISKKIDKICQRLLNVGFAKMVKRHNNNLKRIKRLLPRRESERRTHPLARHADILTCIETRISMLSMTFSKYMELNLCCFIPGKVIDEVFKILKLIESTTKPLRAHEVLQELRDISSMAIEHFDEKIAHLLKKFFLDVNPPKYPQSTSSPNTSRQSVHYVLGIHPNLDDSFAVQSFQNNVQKNNCQLHSPQIHTQTSTPTCTTSNCPEAAANRVLIQKVESKYKLAIKKVNRMIHIQNKQARQLRENSVTISEMNTQITELKRRIEILKSKNSDSNEIIDTSNSSGGTATGEMIEDKIHLRPRTATLILKRRINESPSQSNEDSQEIKRLKND